jgi:hypothetical protein
MAAQWGNCAPMHMRAKPRMMEPKRRGKENALHVRSYNREYLRPLGVSLNHLGRVIGVGSSTVSRWNTGKRKIPAATRLLLRLIAIHGIDSFLATACAPMKSGDGEGGSVK